MLAYPAGTTSLNFSLSKKDGKDQESIQSSNTPGPGYHMGKWQNHNKSQEVSLFQAGDHKAAMNRRESMTNTNEIYVWFLLHVNKI